MAGVSGISNVWNTIKEIDLRPLREDALRLVRIAIVGNPSSGRARLAAQMRRDPVREDIELQTPVTILDLANAQSAAGSDLIILLAAANATDLIQEKSLAQKFSNSGKNVLVFINQVAGPNGGQSLQDWGLGQVIYGSVDDTVFLLNELVPRVIDMLPEDLLPLARSFPLFRIAVANKMINDTCFSNATYSLSTGVAEIIPAIGVPLNVADMVVLTKTQAFLVYKLGLALGLTTDWQAYVTEFGGVLGGGFLWRQVARSLVGMIPAWGIIPKVAVAYSGTYVVGHAVLQWYLTGRHISKKQMQELYSQAYARAKVFAQSLPRLRGRKRKSRELPAPAEYQVGGTQGEVSPVSRRSRQYIEGTPGSAGALHSGPQCPNCGRVNAQDAVFCQYCGTKL